jgi:hypothetical protein
MRFRFTIRDLLWLTLVVAMAPINLRLIGEPDITSSAAAGAEKLEASGWPCLLPRVGVPCRAAVDLR